MGLSYMAGDTSGWEHFNGDAYDALRKADKLEKELADLKKEFEEFREHAYQLLHAHGPRNWRAE